MGEVLGTRCCRDGSEVANRRIKTTELQIMKGTKCIRIEGIAINSYKPLQCERPRALERLNENY